MFKLNTKFDAGLLLYSLSHFECNGHTVHTLTQWCLLSPLTRTVKSLLFMHAHSSALSLAARLHRCHANHSCYINNGWTFSRKTIYTHTHTHISQRLESCPCPTTGQWQKWFIAFVDQLQSLPYRDSPTMVLM